MKKYRRYRRRKRSTYSRMRYKRRFRRRRGATETKVCRLSATGQAITAFYPSSTTTSLPALANFQTNFLSNISQGTTGSTRIGNSIFCKYITLKLTYWACSNVSTSPVVDTLTRFIIGNWRNAAASSVPFMWAIPTFTPLTAPINRDAYTIRYDKTFRNTSAWPNSTTSPGGAYGYIKQVYIKIPVFRKIIYDSVGFVKNDKDVYSLGAISQSPQRVDNVQQTCMDYVINIYYSDN